VPEASDHFMKHTLSLQLTASSCGSIGLNLIQYIGLVRSVFYNLSEAIGPSLLSSVQSQIEIV